MFHQRGFKGTVVVSTGIVLLLVMPVSGGGQSEPVLAEETSGTMEEVIVLGSKSLVKLKHEMYRAEETLHDLLNSFNTDDDFHIRCHKEAPIGSHIRRRDCRPNFVGRLITEATQQALFGNIPYVYPAAEIKKMNERLLADMTETAHEQPEVRKALVKYIEARQTLKSERKRRCEGRFLFCRRQ